MSQKNKKILVVGLIGAGGSGKDTVASYLKKKYQAEEFRFSFILVKALKLLCLRVSRKNLVWLMNTLKEKFGEDILTKAMQKAIEEMSKSQIVVINGLRLPPDYNWVRSFKNNSIIFLKAPARIRWQRVCERKEKEDDNVSFEEFQKLNKLSTEKHIQSLGKKADFTVINDGDLNDLYSKTDKIIEQLLKKQN